MYNEKTIEEIRYFLQELMNVARERNLKLRIRDSIAELQIDFQTEMSYSQFQDKMTEIDELLMCIHRECSAQNMKQGAESLIGISLKEVHQKMENMLAHCVNENKSVQIQALNMQGVYVQHIENEMRELANAKTSVVDDMDATAFCNCFIGLGNKLDQQIKMGMKEYVSKLCDTYTKCMQKMQGMLEEALNIRKRDFYEQWNVGAENIKNEYMQKSLNCVIGTTNIGAFGNKHVKHISQIVKKNKKKRTVHKILPGIVVILLIIAKWGKNLVERVVIGGVETSQETVEKSNVFLSKLQSGLADCIVDTIGAGILQAIGMFAIPAVLILIIILWIVVNHSANKKCKNRIKMETSMYLNKHIDEFWRANPVFPRLEEEYMKYEKEINERFFSIISAYFSQNNSLKENQKDSIQILLEKWSLIKTNR